MKSKFNRGDKVYIFTGNQKSDRIFKIESFGQSCGIPIARLSFGIWELLYNLKHLPQLELNND